MILTLQTTTLYFFGIDAVKALGSLSATRANSIETTYYDAAGKKLGTSMGTRSSTRINSTETTYYDATGKELGTSIGTLSATRANSIETTYYDAAGKKLGTSMGTRSATRVNSTETTYYDAAEKELGTSIGTLSSTRVNSADTEYAFLLSAAAYLKNKMDENKKSEASARALFFAFQSVQSAERKLSKEENFTLDFKQLMQLAQAEDHTAQLLVGLALRSGGRGCTINKEEGNKWILLAAKHMDPPGLCAQGVCFKEGIGNVVNQDKAEEFYIKSMDSGYIPAIYYAAVAMSNKDTPQKDKVVSMMKTCEQAGYIPATMYLAWCKLNAWGMDSDPKQAVQDYLRCADSGYALAKSKLGDCYRNGWGVDKNRDQARMWYKAALEQGYSDAQKGLDALPSTCVVS